MNACCQAGMKAMNGQVQNLGLLTTPILHHCVRAINLTRKYATLDGYSEATIEAVKELYEGYKANTRVILK